MQKRLFAPPSFEDFAHLLRAWRLWLLAALLGALVAAALYALQPPPYRARATVVVSFNMEEAWPDKPDNELFYYLERESRKVEEVAWADATLQQVSQKTGSSLSSLRSGILELSQPQDGAWHFYATSPSPDLARELASSWAAAFTSQVKEGIKTAVSLGAAREALKSKPSDPELLAQIDKLESASLAITPEMQISQSQTQDLPVERITSLAVYLFAGAALGMLLSALLVLLFAPQKGS